MHCHAVQDRREKQGKKIIIYGPSLFAIVYRRCVITIGQKVEEAVRPMADTQSPSPHRSSVVTM